MASYGEGYEGQKHHGNDEYGNPVHQTAGATGMHGTGATTGAHGVGLSTDTYGEPQKLQRSGSSSSSSSEDDGMGGRRKKSIKEKITEKLPGGHKQEQQTHTATPVTGGSYGTTGEKIKEKLPGGHKHEQQTHTATPVNGGSYGTTGEYGATATGEQPFEKKGVMDKIKDKLPGGQH